MFKKISSVVYIIILTFSLISCSREVSRAELETLLRQENFIEVERIIDKYIANNPNDDLGLIAKSFMLIRKSSDWDEIEKTIKKLLALPSITNSFDYQFLMSAELFQNYYCDEALSIFQPKSYSLTDKSFMYYSTIGAGYLYCLDKGNKINKKKLKNKYLTLLVNSNYDFEVTSSYLYFLNENGMKASIPETIQKYETLKPRSSRLHHLALELLKK